MKTHYGLTAVVMIAAASLFWSTQAVGQPAPVTYTSAANSLDIFPMRIPDLGEVTSTIGVTNASFTVKTLTVKLSIKHPLNCDIGAYLIHRDPITTVERKVKLFLHRGGFVDDFVDTELSDAATVSIIEAVAPCTGTFKPEGNLSDFSGMNVQGNWQLLVTDDRVPFSGELQKWSLTFTQCSLCTPANPTPADNAANVGLSPTLSWVCTGATTDTVYDVYRGESEFSMVFVGQGLTDTKCPQTVLKADTWYYWQVVARNCGTVAGPVWKFKTGPVPVLAPITVPADKNCLASVTVSDIDWGSFDPGSNLANVILSPAPPYSIGTTIVTVTVPGSAPVTLTVNVLPTPYCYKKEAIGRLLAIQLPSNVNLQSAIYYLDLSLGADYLGQRLLDVPDELKIFWASADRISCRQGGFHGDRVFDAERKACIFLEQYVAAGGTLDPIIPVYQLVLRADRQLATAAIWEAIFQGVNPQVVAKAREARRAGDVASAAWQAGAMDKSPDTALQSYYTAWQTAIGALPAPTDYNRDGASDVDDLLLFSENLLEGTNP